MDSGDAGSETCRAKPPVGKNRPAGQPFLVGAHLAEHGRSAGHFNGKIEAPCLAAEAVGPADLAGLRAGPRDFPLLAAWDFAQDIETDFIRISGPVASMAAPSTFRPAASPAISGPAGA